jgi:hypothetical protein
MNSPQPTSRRAARPWTTVIAVLIVLALGAAIAVYLIARSSNTASPSVAHIGPTPTVAAQSAPGGTTQNKAAAFSACMRSHGVPSFPDPDSQGHLYLKVTKGGALDPSTPQFQAAQEACKALAPSQNTTSSDAQLTGQMLKYAACMRAHGEPDFPDPRISGGHFLMQLPKGINMNSPQFQSAQQACQSLIPGGGPGSGQ